MYETRHTLFVSVWQFSTSSVVYNRLSRGWSTAWAIGRVIIIPAEVSNYLFKETSVWLTLGTFDHKLLRQRKSMALMTKKI